VPGSIFVSPLAGTPVAFLARSSALPNSPREMSECSLAICYSFAKAKPHGPYSNEMADDGTKSCYLGEIRVALDGPSRGLQDTIR
jgi:hypothetical protein